MPAAAKISVIIITYNHAAFIQQALQAAVQQDYPYPLEIVLCDDASSDNTFELAQQFARDYRGVHKIKLHRHPQNVGVGANLQSLFDLADGEWLIEADGDDISLPARVSTLMRYAAAYPEAVAICSHWQNINEDGSQQWPGESFFEAKGRAVVIPAYHDNHYPLHPLSGCSVAYHRRLVSEFATLPPHLVFCDWLMSWRAFLCGSIVKIPEVLVQYRRHGGNVNGLSRQGKRRSTYAKISERIKNASRMQDALACARRDVQQWCAKNAANPASLLAQLDDYGRMHHLGSLQQWVNMPRGRRLLALPGHMLSSKYSAQLKKFFWRSACMNLQNLWR